MLSGFLITGILLQGRDSIAGASAGWGAVLGRFYARRFLRIFPLYYLVIAIAFVLNVEPTREIIAWLLTYTLNIRIANQGWFDATFAHFWSLCVEEQFYIVWPLLMLSAPRRWLKPVALLTVWAALVFRFSYVLSGYTNMTGLATLVSTFASLDALGIGALLAMCGVRNDNAYRRFGLVAVPVAVCILIGLDILRQPYRLLFYDTVLSLILCFLVWGASRRFSGVTGRVLEWGPLLYIGKISYGVYVYHPFAPDILRWSLGKIGIVAPPAVMVTAATAFTFIAASVSWFAFEKPLNALKRHF